MADGRGRGHRWWREQWRLGRPFSLPALDENPIEWLPRHRQARRLLIRKALGGVLVLALVGGSTLAVEALRRNGRQHAIQAEVRRLERFVERERGHRFTHDVPVTFKSSAQFEAEDSGGSALRNLLVGLYPAFRPLGLSTGPSDPTAIAEAASRQELGAYGDDGRIIVRETSITPLTRRILVHELTHALDDQTFSFADLKDLRMKTGSVDALIEGDARRVEGAYVASVSAADRLSMSRALRKINASGSNVPLDIDELVDFPYRFGLAFVRRLAADGGESAVDDAFLDPPVLDSEILHPEVFENLRARAAVLKRFNALPTPTAVGPVLGVVTDQYFLGEFLTRLFLEQSLPADEAARAAAAWNGDSMAFWYDGTKFCVRVWYGIPTSAARAKVLHDALKAWAATRKGASAENRHLGVLSCV